MSNWFKPAEEPAQEPPAKRPTERLPVHGHYTGDIFDDVEFVDLPGEVKQGRHWRREAK